MLLLSSFDHERDIFVTTTFGDIVSFCCLGKTSQAFSRERTTFSIANFDYKTIQDFTRKQCQLKSADQANTHTHTHTQTERPLYPTLTPTRGSGNYISKFESMLSLKSQWNNIKKKTVKIFKNQRVLDQS